jgi:hypothetical protein
LIRLTSGPVRILASITAAMIVPVAAHAQELPKTLAAFTTDSTAWQRVLVYTVERLSSVLLASAADPTTQPWRLEFPSDDPQEQLIRTQLRTLLRMRQAMPADTLVRSLEFGPLVISNDTARVDVRFSETRKCPASARTTGIGWSTTVLVPREPKQKFWGIAVSRTTMGGDRGPCPLN